MQSATKRPKTLDEALMEPTTSTWDFYDAVTGKDFWESGLLFGKVPSFDVKPQDVDKIYELVLRLKRSYEKHFPPEDRTRRYYVEPCERIKAAYKSGNLEAFKSAVSYLLVSIMCD